MKPASASARMTGMGSDNMVVMEPQREVKLLYSSGERGYRKAEQSRLV